MTREEAIKILRREIECLSHTKCEDCILDAVCDPIKTTPYDSEYIEVYEMAIKALDQEPCEDAISRQAVKAYKYHRTMYPNFEDYVDMLPSVNLQEPKTGHCKGCKYFEYDSVAKVDGVPLIVAHEICSRWGDGCKTKENGYCFLFEPQESEDEG